MLFTYNDLVRVSKNAPKEYRPGQLGAVCGVNSVSTPARAEELFCQVGSTVYIIEYGDGSSNEIAEQFLESAE